MKTLHLIPICALMGACAPVEEAEECPFSAGADTDSDGLLDCEEFELGTAVRLADTDGDGLSDFIEVVELGFSPQNNNFKFNPRISDLPQIGVELVSAPDIELFFTDSEGVTRSSEVERSEASRSSVTSSRSVTESRAVETAITTGSSVTAGFETGILGGFSGSATVSFESSVSTTQEESVTFSEEQTQENEVGLAVAEGLAASAETVIDGGRLAVAASAYNNGDIAFTLESLVVGALMTTPTGDSILRPIGNLEFDSTEGIFPAQTLSPGQRVGPLVFDNDRLGTGTVRSLLEDASGLDLRVVAYQLLDESGIAFNHNQTEVLAKTATVLIDFGPDRPVERYAVATNVDEGRLQVDGRAAFQDILRIPYTVNADGELDSLRDRADDAAANGFWVVLHQFTDGVSTVVDVTDPDGAPLAFDTISLRSGDVLHVTYFSDEDRDGLGLREELAMGLDPLNADTDGDGLTDGEEVYETGTNPRS